MSTTRTIQILTFSTMPALALEGWNPNACSGEDYQTPRAAALYSALGVKASDEEYALAASDDGRWALIGLTTSGHRYAAEVDVEIEEEQLTPADTAEIERKAIAAAG